MTALAFSSTRSWRALPSSFGRIAAALLVAASLAGCSTSNTLEVKPTASVTASSFVDGKYAALVIDAANGKVLYAVNERSPRYPASLTKMMTLYILFEALQSGQVNMATQIPVSVSAASQPPSKIGLRPGETIDVDTAIRALAVKSGNDVAAAVGEYFGGGTEEGAAALMTAKARSLGMNATTFRNASGLPDPLQTTTARDMAVLGLALQKRFPQHFHYFSDTQFAFKGKVIRGHNDMLGRVQGVDGIKTGYIRASGFNIVTSVNRGGRRLIVVVMGGDTARKRNAHVEELIERYLPSSPFAQPSAVLSTGL
ncbi:D-alanyl-D-alanine carboxypeptidase family protein [Oryzicola mucosus]|uniref:D-alanyl-D-alanine carboxypeptidase n=1 Tax=Oryzicola mucosus TaxID=2767425 RepID=A0A8J6PGT5_9HYPH|nr:D-alanyl-D-alanine carboxypeptidase family protein [Oryzicola mucosus]MBD0413688.1 D-alanyl-D-alanine carboxypeptidase [Oryzicola mucosus]